MRLQSGKEVKVTGAENVKDLETGTLDVSKHECKIPRDDSRNWVTRKSVGLLHLS